MQIHGLNKTTLLDYPGHIAATIFTGGCNFRCPFCHNASLVINPASSPLIPSSEILTFLEKRKNILSGVCITGGEPTLQPDLSMFLFEIKKMGYLIMLDTNGTNPDMITTLFQKGLLDYVAMDIKSSKNGYYDATGVTTVDLQSVESSIHFLMSANINYEFRTTLVEELHTEEEILSIGHWIKGAKAYYLQPYKDSPDTIRRGYHTPSLEAINRFVSLLQPFVPSVKVRGID